MRTNGHSGDLGDAHHIEVAPNCSMTPAGAIRFFAWIAVCTLALAAVFAWHGLWPVLPFAGLELAMLGASLWISMRRSAYREVISVDDSHVVIRQGDREVRHTEAFPRAWARVRLVPSHLPSYPSRLELGSHGRWIEVGRCLTETERLGLKSRLESLVYESDGQAQAVS